MKKNAFELFLKQKRFDLVFKYLYLKYPNNEFVKKSYLENIRAFNNFHEIEPSDGVPKNSANDFINKFDMLYKSIKDNDYNATLGVLPIGYNGEISDGAHRLSICAYLNKDICVESDERNDIYDYKFFIRQKMDRMVMDYGALEYVKLNKNSYIVNLHSVVDTNKDIQVVKCLEKYGFIYYKKDIRLTFNGYVNLKKLSYGSFWEKESWIGTVKNKFAGAQYHAKCSMGRNPLRVFVFVCDDFQKLKKVKFEIRTLCNIGNYSVHINDSHEEAVQLAELYFNENSIRIFNNRSLEYEDYVFDRNIDKFKQFILDNGIDVENVCMAGSTPLNVVGIRKSQDLDFLYCGQKKINIQNDIFSNHDSELKYYPYSKADIINNPRYHFYYHGLKFVSLNVLYKMKQKRAEFPKDINDCEQIKLFINNKYSMFNTFNILIKTKIKKLIGFIGGIK